MEWRLRHPGGMRAEVSEENGMSVGYDCAEISSWNDGYETSRGNGMSVGYDCAEISGWNGGCETSRENGMSVEWNGG